MQRRKFLLGGAAAVGIAALGTWGFGRMGLEAKIVAVLRRHLDFLQLEPEGVQAFAKDQVNATFNKKIPTWTRLKYHYQSSVAPSFARYYRSTDRRSRIAKLEDTLVSNYLLSSDFFLNKADESRVVQYVAFYDPLRACGNPFARPAVDAAANT